MDYAIHEVANLFPYMQSDEYEGLKRDIRVNGQRDPIWLHENKIIDGRNRYKACSELGIQPKFQTWDGQGSLVAFVVSMNLHRRHLTSSQMAFVALEIERYEAIEAKQRMTAGINQYSSPVQRIAQGDTGKARDKAVEAVGNQTNRQYVSDAKRLEADAPELAAQVKSGELTIPKAMKIVKRAERQAKMSGDNYSMSNNTVVDLVHGDMLDVLRGSDCRYDLVVADPPYNVTDHAWDIYEDDFLERVEMWLDAVKGVLAAEYNLFWFCSPRYAADTEMLFRRFALPIKSRVIWHRRNMALGSHAKEKFVDSWEMILHAGNRTLNFPDTWSEAWFDVQTFAAPQSNFDDEKIHPTQKPIGLIQRLVEFGSFPGDQVLDPFAGGGTTGAACLSIKERYCTIIEKDGDYANRIRTRLGL